MSNEFKMVPLELLERVVNIGNSFGQHRQAQHDLVQFLAAPQPPALDGELVNLIIRDLCETEPHDGTDAVHLRVGELEAILQAHLAPLQAENRRLRQFETALSEWADKTEWLRITIQPKELGMHLADVMKGRIDQLTVTNELLRDRKNSIVMLKSERDQLEALLSRVIDSSVLAFEQDGPEELQSLEADICATLSKPAGSEQFANDIPDFSPGNGNKARRRAEELRALAAQPANHQGEQMACMPVERCYDVRAKMIIAFNEAKNAGGDLDDQLDAAYKSALRFSPNPQ